MDIAYRRRAIHCIPIEDTRLHAAQAVCPCHPLEVEDGVGCPQCLGCARGQGEGYWGEGERAMGADFGIRAC